MDRVFPAGPAAAYAQGILVVAITVAHLLFALWEQASPDHSSVSIGTEHVAERMQAYAVFPRYQYLPASIALILIKRPYFEKSSVSIRQQITRIDPITPRKETEWTFARLTIATICFGIAALQPPANVVVAILKPIAPAWMATAIWSGILSVAVAALGANAIAARRAF